MQTLLSKNMKIVSDQTIKCLGKNG